MEIITANAPGARLSDVNTCNDTLMSNHLPTKEQLMKETEIMSLVSHDISVKSEPGETTLCFKRMR